MKKNTLDEIKQEISNECMIPGRRLKKYTIIYNFNHSKMGFNNSMTLDAFSIEHAIGLAKIEVAGVYGSDMLKRFSFKPDAAKTSIVTH